MANLADLIKKQKEQAGADVHESTAGGSSPTVSESVKPAGAGAKLNFLAKAKAAAPVESLPVADDEAGPQDFGPPAVDSLEALAASTDMGSAPVKEKRTFDFEVDRIDAEAPVRDLDPELLEKNKEFVDLLDSMYSNANEPEILKQVCVNIMIELQAHPEMECMLADKDLRTMVIAARNSMGLARIKKTEKSRGASKGTTASRGKKAIDADAILADLGIDLGDLG